MCLSLSVFLFLVLTHIEIVMSVWLPTSVSFHIRSKVSWLCYQCFKTFISLNCVAPPTEDNTSCSYEEGNRGKEGLGKRRCTVVKGKEYMLWFYVGFAVPLFLEPVVGRSDIWWRKGYLCSLLRYVIKGKKECVLLTSAETKDK